MGLKFIDFTRRGQAKKTKKKKTCVTKLHQIDLEYKLDPIFIKKTFETIKLISLIIKYIFGGPWPIPMPPKKKSFWKV